ncbi:MAG: HAD-IC family P-type ATPase [Bacilli bacterium]
MERYNPNIEIGLTTKQVNKRVLDKLVNYDTAIPTKTIPKIIFGNLFNLFNFLNLGLALAVFLVGSYKNLFFMGIVICNTIISTFQAIRSKLIVDKLSIISSTKTKVIRNSQAVFIDINEIVLDDIMLLKIGNQVVCDAIIMEGEVFVNESFITGEADVINYKKGALLKSGSFITSGSCKAKVEHIGIENYTHIISKDAKYIKKMNSILMVSLNKIIKIVSIIIVPLSIFLFTNQMHIANNMTQAVLNTVAALIGMIPEGLVLLTSTVLAVSVIRLAKLKVLVQELYCIEMLARVDTICLDKTGTITNGQMEVVDVIPLKKNNVEEIMGNFINKIDNDNTTMEALNKYFKKQDNFTFIKKIPFSSLNKCSTVIFKEGTFTLGAPEFIYDKPLKEVNDNIDKYRVLLLCKDNCPILVITLKDTIRASFSKTLAYFKKQDVNIKIISGDNVNTVMNIAKEVGMDDIRGIDVSKIEDLETAVLNNNIFGRVSPIQKKEMVKILQNNKHFVAMTGDGVNDVLALKQADCSITVSEASDAALNVSQLVLLDSNFDVLPSVVKEGRRTINNIERSATLFLAKTTYAFLLGILFAFLSFNYPFEPIQLTLTNFFTIGIPSFILALEPNNERIKGNFLINVFSKALPTALTIVANIVIITVVGNFFQLGNVQISTLCVILTGFTGFLLLFKLCMPLNKLRLGLISILIISFIISVVGLRDFFSLTLLVPKTLVLMIGLVFLSTIIFNLMHILIDKIITKYPKVFS